MRKIFLILVLFLGVSVTFAQEKTAVKWEISFDKAIKKAKKENKPVLVYFTGSDWCPPCKKIDKELFHAEKFQAFSDKNLILYKADFPRNRDLVSSETRASNKGLKSKYGVSAFPSMVVVNANGTVLGEKRGAYMTEYYYPFLEEIVKSNF